jgi:hypothetical protein
MFDFLDRVSFPAYLIFSVRQLKKHWKFGKGVAGLFIGFEKAYDSMKGEIFGQA